MKNIFILIIASFIVTSCYSYKPTTISPQEMIVGKRYLIDTNDKREIRGYVASVNENSVTIQKNKKSKQKDVDFNKVKNIETSKFSTGKTIGLGAIINVGAILVFLIIALNSVGI